MPKQVDPMCAYSQHKQVLASLFMCDDFRLYIIETMHATENESKELS